MLRFARAFDFDRHIVQILLLAQDAETGQRGFLLTVEEGNLEPCNSAAAVLPAEIEALRAASGKDTQRRDGSAVLHAESREEALRALRANPKIDLLFTDIIMPGINGRKLADEALKLDASMRSSSLPASPATPSCTMACSTMASTSSRSRLRSISWPTSCARCCPPEAG